MDKAKRAMYICSNFQVLWEEGSWIVRRLGISKFWGFGNYRKKYSDAAAAELSDSECKDVIDAFPVFLLLLVCHLLIV